MVKRRELLQTALVVGGAAAVPRQGAAAETVISTALPDDLVATVRASPPMNLARAYQVLEQENLAGLILANPLNVSHLTGYWPQLAKMGYSAPSFALLTRDQRQAPGLVTSQFLYYYIFADAGFQYALQTYLFGGWKERGATPGETETIKPYTFADLDHVPKSAIEENRLATLQRALETGTLSGDVEKALRSAIKDMGLDRGRVGIDHPTIAAVFEMADFSATPTYAENVLRKIRLIKSDNEIKLMRYASETNATAALAAAKAVRAGPITRNCGRLFSLRLLDWAIPRRLCPWIECPQKWVTRPFGKVRDSLSTA